MPGRDEIMLAYLERLAYPPYPVQEEAILAWAECDQGVLLSAPTGTGKTLVAEAAIYEGLVTGKQVYYSTPLIALTDQKLIELQETVQRWGYAAEQVGLVTGHRTVNPDAPIKVVVAEVLLNRLLHQQVFDFGQVGTVVMDEFHNFNEPQRGIVWELALSLLPKHVRVMLLSATVGAADEFVELDGPQPRPAGDAGRRERTKSPAALSLGRRRTAPGFFGKHRPRSGNPAPHARPGVLLRPRSVLGHGRGPQGQRSVRRRSAEITFGPAGSVRLFRRRRQQTADGARPRDRHSPRRAAAPVPAGGRNAVPGKAAALLRVHRNPRGGAELAGPVGDPHDAHQGTAGQEKADRHRSRPTDFRPGGAAAVRLRRARLRHGPRGRREAGPVERKIRLDPRGHQRPRPDESQKSTGEKEADPAVQLHVLERRPVPETANRPPPPGWRAGAI